MDGFKVRISGTGTFRDINSIDDDHLDAPDIVEGFVYNVSVGRATVEDITVTIEADLVADDIEVAISDIDGFDAESWLDEAIGHHDYSLYGVDFEVTDSPAGFEAVEQATDRDTAIQVYVALANAGFDVI